MESACTLDQFLQQVERRALGMAIVATNNRDDGLEIVQEAMLKFAENYATKPQKEWAPLFYRVLQNQIRDWQRRSKVRNRWRIWLRDKPEEEQREVDPLQSLADPNAKDPFKDLAHSVAIDKLKQALTLLPARQKEVFLLRIWEGLDVSQTAVAMEISEGSVKTHFSRAIHHLRNQLEGHWP